MKKNKKSIFITGAASGIGKATAIYFSKMGWEVGLFDINEDGLEDVAKEIGHNSCMYQKLDVTNIEDEYERLLKNGVKFHSPPQDFGEVKATYGRDIDGNVFEIQEIIAENHPAKVF